uniref:BrnT family toxin n=1 Tax=Candidatus Methanogaster sp. ANME-2c ERB4 TaxID=2759911 RepID=A0A7G9Y122_9EURY|nr:hypothetical protein NEBFCOPL_00007 [Methanosarcinales archaeon ANME-2c ERB4]
MLLKEIIWIDKFALKIQRKHHVTVVEVEESLLSRAIFRRSRRGIVEGEDVYVAYGKTVAGRYLFTVFIYKRQNTGLVLSARDMTLKERRYYNAKKKS